MLIYSEVSLFSPSFAIVDNQFSLNFPFVNGLLRKETNTLKLVSEPLTFS